MKPVESDNGLYRKFWVNSQGQPYQDGYHCGKDYGLDEGLTVRAVCDGEISLAGLFMGYGSLNPSSLGGALWIKHNTKNDKVFFGHYGHLIIDPDILNKSKKTVKEGDIIGKIAHFFNGYDKDGNQIYLPHLHFGVWNSENMYPLNRWGYTPINDKLNWTDPVQFLIDNNLV